ncbi:MAG: hypothetical protein NT030_08525, partial [Candidatus Saganbacteria bacterium]|nr:hypothetical protein [Candidatus Saganbacteria bacterium]
TMISTKCVNHPHKKALSVCYGCKRSFYSDCLIEGPQSYYCNSETCLKLYEQEIDYANNPRFCPKCISETTEEASGDIISVNLVGYKFIYESQVKCQVCGSIVAEKIGPLFGRKGAYRIIWLNPEKTKFISRKKK